MTHRMTLVLVACAAACNAPSLEGGPNRGGVRRLPDGGVDLDGGQFEQLPDGAVVPVDPGDQGGQDSDFDGVPDQADCDPADSNIGARVVEDDLAEAKGLLHAAGGFDDTAWVHANGAFRQMQLRDRADISLFAPTDLENVVIDVQAATTEIGTFNPKLRQNFVVVGASSHGGDFFGYGCGVEVVEGSSNELKASIVGLSGNPYAITTSPIKRADREPLLVDEDYAIRVRIQGGNIACTITQKGHEMTVAAVGVGPVRGSVGLLTRQSKARFSNARICIVR